MIQQNNSQLDREDVAVLFAAMVQVERKHGRRLDRTMISFGYGEGLARAIAAAGYVAQMHVPEGGEWDGVYWFELLERTSAKSLAYLLYVLDISEEDDDSYDWHEAIQGAVIKWFNNIGETCLLDIETYPNLNSAGNLLLGDE